MSIKELLQALVETDDKMERMSLVEDNQELLAEPEPQEEATEAEPQEDYKAKYEELQKKYIATFFGGAEKEPEKEPEKKTQSIDDLKFD
jgi:hypothetical protein